jgi:hypothetical protein
MDAKKINAIEMTRKIRDDHAKRLAGKSHAERIAFYRERARIMEKKIPVLLSELAIAEGRRGDYSKGRHEDRHARLDNQGVNTIARRIQEKRGTYKKK